MNQFFNKYKLFLSIFFSICIIILMLFYDALKLEKSLPVYSPSMVNFELVDSTLQHVKKFHRIADFKLKNQNNEWVTNKTFDKKIYVADFFFTTCPSICPIMTDNMSILQNFYKKDTLILLLSHSVTPKIDSVAQLKKYALEKGIIDKKWHLVTGPKKQIYDLARRSYLAAKNNGDGGPYDMIHTENFILVDPDQRIRGFYDGTLEEDIEKIKTDIELLRDEYSMN
ncbi:MAG: SCO family protein [Flavobacteriales bacterium]|nr:SCO family protein [Flavobacteriales bacterium]